MSYSETLSSMIEKSNLSLREVAETCYRQSRLRIDASYISKLQTGKQSPASEDVNIALAKACNADPDELVYQAYMEKAPGVIRGILNDLSSKAKQMWSDALSTDLAPTPKLNLPAYKIIKGFISTIDDFNEFEDAMEEHTEELKFIFGTYPVMDDGMAPTIPKYADVTLAGKEPVAIGDVVYVEFKNNDDPTVRRYFLLDGQIHLIPDNKRYSTVVVNDADVNIIKVDSYTIRL